MIRLPLSFAASVAASLLFSATCVVAASVPANIQAAIADSSRPDADKERDATRKPGETLTFMGVKAGENVAELIPGGGYFTRLLSVAVGPKGHVYALAPERQANAPADRPEPAAKAKAIAADTHYSNVTVVVPALASFFPPAPVDLIFTAQNYHDLHNLPADVLAFNKQLFNSLKPGGLYVVLDHSAEAGSGLRDTKTLHRIDSEAVKKELTEAGFEFIATGGFLANAADPRTATVFDPSIRGKTDQFILKFRKPKK